MICPKCGSKNTYVNQSGELKSGDIRRHRVCKDCASGWNTVELPYANYKMMVRFFAGIKEAIKTVESMNEIDL